MTEAPLPKEEDMPEKIRFQYGVEYKCDKAGDQSGVFYRCSDVDPIIAERDKLAANLEKLSQDTVFYIKLSESLGAENADLKRKLAETETDREEWKTAFRNKREHVKELQESTAKLRTELSTLKAELAKAQADISRIKGRWVDLLFGEDEDARRPQDKTPQCTSVNHCGMGPCADTGCCDYRPQEKEPISVANLPGEFTIKDVQEFNLKMAKKLGVDPVVFCGNSRPVED